MTTAACTPRRVPVKNALLRRKKALQGFFSVRWERGLLSIVCFFPSVDKKDRANQKKYSCKEQDETQNGIFFHHFPAEEYQGKQRKNQRNGQKGDKYYPPGRKCFCLDIRIGTFPDKINDTCKNADDESQFFSPSACCWKRTGNGRFDLPQWSDFFPPLMARTEQISQNAATKEIMNPMTGASFMAVQHI